MATAAPITLSHHPLTQGQPYVYRYVPVMKTKAGEITALDNLPAAVRDRILPLFHVTETLKPTFVPGLASVWAGRPAGVDGSFNATQSGSTATVVAAIAAMRASGIRALPCWSITDPAPYQQVCASLVDSHGAMVKTDLHSIGLAPAAVSQLGVWPSSTDLIISLGHLAGQDPQSYGGYVAHQLAGQSAVLALFRSVTLVGAAAPKDYSALSYGANVLPRTDWLIWQVARSAVPGRLDYGDFMTGHPDLTEPPGAAMAKATVSVRYTRDNDLLVMKGYATTGPNGQPMRQQYQAHAGVLQGSAGFSGVNSWADAQISLAAGGAPGMGSRAKWSAFSANRHICLVVDRLP